MMILIKKLAINFVTFSMLALNASCQNTVNTSSVPSFSGGPIELDRYVRENMEWTQSQLTTEGTVLVSFVVDSLGHIGNVKVKKSLCESCDAEAVRIVKRMPNWVPAKKEGKPISSEAMVSIPFKLSEN